MLVIFTLKDGEPSEFSINEETGETTPPIDENELVRLGISGEVSSELFLRIMLHSVANPLDMIHDLGETFIRKYAECRTAPIIVSVNEWFDGHQEALQSRRPPSPIQRELIWAFSLEKGRHENRQADEQEMGPGRRVYVN